METKDNKGSFDRLVSELSTEDRTDMLKKIKKTTEAAAVITESDKNDDFENVTLRLKYKNESVFYKFFLWVRSVFKKRNTEEIYNSDLLGGLAKQISREFPGILNHHSKVLDSVFYERLTLLKDAADFFRPYFSKVDENPGDFYVFLASVIVPDFAESINSKVDPFTLSFDTEPSNEVRNGLLKKLDDCLKGINPDLKSRLYKAVSSVNWLERFSRLPFIHFSSQFTNLSGDSYTCTYKNARDDFELFATVFANLQSVDDDVLKALIKFSPKVEGEDSSSGAGSGAINSNTSVGKAGAAIDKTSGVFVKDDGESGALAGVPTGAGNSGKSSVVSGENVSEKVVNDFISRAGEYLSSVHMFAASVPVIRIGKIINNNFEWMPEHLEGVEAWFKGFRNSWRKSIDLRWNMWIVQRRKNILSVELREDFKLPDFPLLKYRPWNDLWSRVPFTCELTGGFLAWFSTTYYEKILSVLNIVIMEGIFTSSENRSIYSEGLNSFVQAMNGIVDLQNALSPEGEFGKFFDESVNNKIRSFQIQSKIDSMLSKIEAAIHDFVTKFNNGCQMIEKIFAEMFDGSKNSRQDVLQNFMSIKGLKNREWRESLLKIRKLLKKGVFYVSEISDIEAGK